MSGKNCDRLPFSTLVLEGPLMLYIFFPLILAIHLLIMQVATWVPVPSAAFFNLLWVAANKVILECLSHLPPSLTCHELQQTMWYCSGVISSLMQPDFLLWAFNAEVTASLGIAPPPRPHCWPTVLVFLFRMPGEAVLDSVPFSPSVTSVRWGQGCPRQHLLAAWTFFVHPWTFLLPRHGPWTWYEMGRGCHILRPHRYT